MVKTDENQECIGVAYPALAVVQDYLTAKNRQASDYYQLSRAIAAEIINTLAEAGIAPKQELESLLAAAGITITDCKASNEIQLVAGNAVFCETCSKHLQY
ncbi:hypothetical protein SG34_003200 [Thalassomonas viridans]|uniref:Uncharacterized protein n=1 Tax=Thalassomonas viridans TaxID=137584 RepID=A0AAE9Z364_9GAMM|nr:hypothetical protein [Thalassomonas viridans]WDE05951.1 hypothetical protein SG34_003200 [Thalassomonas viridans]